MNLEQLTIGKMAKLNGVSEQTLRLYDKMGLLVPQGVNSTTGYRYYTIGQSAQLDLIQYYQHIGFSLKDIQSKLMSPDATVINNLLVKRSEELTEQINYLEQCKKAIYKTIDSYNNYNSLPKNGHVFMEYHPERQIIVYNTGDNMFDFDYNHYEYNLRKFKNYLHDIKFNAPLFGNVGTIIRAKDISTKNFHSSEIFLFLDDTTETFPNIETIPAGTYISICGSNFDNEKQYAQILFDEIQKENLSIEGDYFCEVLSEYPSIIKEQRQFYYKIQLKLV